MDFSLDESVRNAVLKRIYEKFDVRDDIDPDLFEHARRCLDEAVESGLGAEISIGDPDPEFLRELKRNNAVFAAFKAHREQNDLAALLTDDEGNLRSYDSFRKASEPVIGRYNADWLHTEYVTAVSAARTAARFRLYMRDAGLFPNLRWLPSSAAEPRISHRAYYGNVRALTDPWWRTHYPGCVWNCQCDMENTDDPITHIGDRPVVPGEKPTRDGATPASPGLDRNPAYTGSIFTDNHPYVTEAYEGAGKAVERLMEKEDRYETVPTEKGRLRIHEGHGKGEREENIRVASYFTDKYGYHIDLLDNPDNVKSADSFNRTLGYEEEYKVSRTPSANSIDRLLRDARKQADHIVLWVDSNISVEDLSAALRSRVRRSENIQTVTIVIDGKDVRLERADILSEGFKIRLADLK